MTSFYCQTLRLPAAERHQATLNEVTAFLQQTDLLLDADCDHLVVARDDQGKLIACGALARDVVKCIAMDETLRGEGLSLKLMNELRSLAWDLGRRDLFLFTRPKNEAIFSQCGFKTLAKVPDLAVLMENNPLRLQQVVQKLEAQRQPGDTIGCVVINANPFTLGHQYLLETAASQCDWLFVFVVKEDLSLFPYADRLALIQQGSRHIPNLSIVDGANYLISRATFPSYFLKDEGVIDQCHAAMDCQLFRKYLAPALRVQVRFVGNEPFCAVTNDYNQQMQRWFTSDEIDAPPLQLRILERKQNEDTAISASEVRRLWLAGKSAEHLVPADTWRYLQCHQAPSP